jgi:hypothetical protein
MNNLIMNKIITLLDASDDDDDDDNDDLFGIDEIFQG